MADARRRDATPRTAIRRLAVRGAPLIGIAAAYGLAMEVAARAPTPEPGMRELRDARPTAVNLAWAVDRVWAAAQRRRCRGGPRRGRAHRSRRGRRRRRAIAAHGADLLAGARRILTHCNTGALATGGAGPRWASSASLRRAATSRSSRPRRARCCRARG